MSILSKFIDTKFIYVTYGEYEDNIPSLICLNIRRMARWRPRILGFKLPKLGQISLNSSNLLGGTARFIVLHGMNSAQD